MTDNPAFAVLGGDERYAMLATQLSQDGYIVFAAGFDMLNDGIEGVVQTNAVTAAALAGRVILPLTPTKDGANLYAPLSSQKIPLDDSICERMHSAEAVYTGQPQQLKQALPGGDGMRLRDYSANEGFLVANAQLTAEAAVMLAVQHTRCSIYGCRCLITGYGRIGKATAGILRAMGAKLTIAARKPADFALVESAGMERCSYAQLPDKMPDYSLVINTAPAPVLSKSAISCMDATCVIIDLASAPGGTDFEYAEQCGIKAVHALGLPGKYAPLTAARIIKQTILDMTEEEHI